MPLIEKPQRFSNPLSPCLSVSRRGHTPPLSHRVQYIIHIYTLGPPSASTLLVPTVQRDVRWCAGIRWQSRTCAVGWKEADVTVKKQNRDG